MMRGELDAALGARVADVESQQQLIRLEAYGAQLLGRRTIAHLDGNLSDPGELVLDPMLGSGTTATACLRAGRQVVGTDIDPMALLLARVATTVYDRAIPLTC